MTTKTVVHANEEAKITQKLIEDGEGNLVLHTQQDVTALIDENRNLFNQTEKSTKWGEMTRVASIPLSIYYSPEFQKISRDQNALRKWLNDPDNAAFRTRAGKV